MESYLVTHIKSQDTLLLVRKRSQEREDKPSQDIQVFWPREAIPSLLTIYGGRYQIISNIYLGASPPVFSSTLLLIFPSSLYPSTHLLTKENLRLRFRMPYSRLLATWQDKQTSTSGCNKVTCIIPTHPLRTKNICLKAFKINQGSQSMRCQHLPKKENVLRKTDILHYFFPQDIC